MFDLQWLIGRRESSGGPGHTLVPGPDLALVPVTGGGPDMCQGLGPTGGLQRVMYLSCEAFHLWVMGLGWLSSLGRRASVETFFTSG